MTTEAGGAGGERAGRVAVVTENTRIVYFATPPVAVAPLRALREAGFDVMLVVTGPPKRRGRRQAPSPSPVAAAAGELSLPVTFDVADERIVDADLGVVVAYGEHIPDSVLERLPVVNLHFSLLPRWRGPAPVERAILAGDSEAGVCLMEVASELDMGGVYQQASLTIRPQETAEELRSRLCEAGIGLLLDALGNGFGEPKQQSGAATWADKITPAELRIDWTAPAESILRLVRVGGAWTLLRGRRLKILAARPAADSTAVAETASSPCEGSDKPAQGAGSILCHAPADPLIVATGDDPIELLTVQAEGRSALSAQDWLRGVRLNAGDRLG